MEHIDSLLSSKDLNQPEERKRAIYSAFSSKDARFDGRIFVGVSSTRIYCRPVCGAKMPKYGNCTFFHTAAEAEAAGYRPCMTCRPESAPGMSNVDARSSLARRAALMLRDGCSNVDSIEKTASRLGYTGRHLRRVFVETYGVTPLQYVQTCRLLLAKEILTDTEMPVARAALAAGFKSVRRFNQVFKEQYRLTPTELRKSHRSGKRSGDKGGSKTDACLDRPDTMVATDETPPSFTLRLGYRPPFRFEALLEFFRARAIPGIEAVSDKSYARAVELKNEDGSEASGWFCIKDNPAKNQIILELSDSLAPHIPQVIGRVRRMFDIDCDPVLIARQISAIEEISPASEIEGIRLPGSFDAFEMACRAILGQQISVQAANRLAARIVESYGKKVDADCPFEGLSHVWPTPERICSLNAIEDKLGVLGVIKTRSRTIAEIARLILEGELDLSWSASPEEQIERLLSIKGIGPWTANYIAMRTMGYTDAFLETDAGVAHALPNLTPKERVCAVEECRPWRSYAVIALWDSLAG